MPCCFHGWLLCLAHGQKEELLGGDAFQAVGLFSFFHEDWASSTAQHCFLQFSKLSFTLNIIYLGRQIQSCKYHPGALFVTRHISEVALSYIPAAMLTSPLSALRWGLSSPLLSSSSIKPSVLEWNGSLLLTDCVYGCPWNTLVVPKGGHFSISIPYNFISIWQLLTVCQVQEKNGYKNMSLKQKVEL